MFVSYICLSLLLFALAVSRAGGDPAVPEALPAAQLRGGVRVPPEEDAHPGTILIQCPHSRGVIL